MNFNLTKGSLNEEFSDALLRQMFFSGVFSWNGPHVIY